MSNSVASMTVDATAAAAVSYRSRFFLVMAIVLFLPVAVGFGPTFFLRPWSGAKDYLGGPFPVHLVIHGSVLSAWYLLFIVQTTLVAAHRCCDSKAGKSSTRMPMTRRRGRFARASRIRVPTRSRFASSSIAGNSATVN